MGTLLMLSQALLAQPKCEPPALQSVRYDEDYRYLADPACRTEAWDEVKYVRMGRREDRYLSIGGEIRQRYDYLNNTAWGIGAHGDNGYSLERYMLHTDLQWSDRLRFFGQLKSGLEYGRAGGPGPPDRDALDVNQAFAEVTLNASAGGKLRLRVGRQEMKFGSSRLVSVRDGPNVHWTFDGARLLWASPDWQVDAFAVKAVQTNRGIFDDSPEHRRSFWGIYAVRPFRVVPNAGIDLYYLGVDNKNARFDSGAGREQRHSVGARVWGNGAKWDYDYETIFQWGRFGSGNIRAWTVSSDSGYRIDSRRFQPRLGLKADLISGDRNPSDRTLGTFNAPYPKGGYFSEADLIGPNNLFDVHPYIEFRLSRNVSLTPDADFFWRQSIHDGVYSVDGSLLVSGKNTTARYIGAHAGSELDWHPSQRWTVTGVYLHFFTGGFLRYASPGKQINYVALFADYRF